MDDVNHAGAFTGAEVNGEVGGMCKVFKCLDVPNCQIDDVDVIAHPGSIRRLVVVAPDIDLPASSDGNLRNKRHQIIRNTKRIFANQTALMRATRIEITQYPYAQLLLRFDTVTQNLFDHNLASTVRIGGGQRMLFIKWQIVRIAIDGR